MVPTASGSYVEFLELVRNGVKVTRNNKTLGEEEEEKKKYCVDGLLSV